MSAGNFANFARGLAPMREVVAPLRELIESVVVDSALLPDVAIGQRAAQQLDELSTSIRAVIELRPDLSAAHQQIMIGAANSVTESAGFVERLGQAYRTDHAASVSSLRFQLSDAERGLAHLAGEIPGATTTGAAANLMPRLSGRHAATLERVASPTTRSMRWNDIESLLRHLGADITEREGSAISVRLRDEVTSFHRPHPSRDAVPAAIADTRKFLTAVGVISA